MKQVRRHFTKEISEGILEGRITQMRSFVDVGKDVNVDELDIKLILDANWHFVIRSNNGMWQNTEFNINDRLYFSQSYRMCFEELLKRVDDVALQEDFRKFIPFIPDVLKEVTHCVSIKNVGLERLQDISYEDCMAEGIIRVEKEYCYACNDGPVKKYYAFPTPRKAYAAFINHCRGEGTWERNPYVVVYEFKLID
mgnify:CR=1 FL=1